MNLSSNLPGLLAIDCEQETQKITSAIRRILSREFRKRGAVVGVSGGIDSSVTLALCVRALGSDRVTALLMPESHSAPETRELSMMVCNRFSVEPVEEDITSILESLGFYRRYTEAVQKVIPEYDSTWKSKITIPPVSEKREFTLFSLIAQSPDGKTITHRLPLEAYLEIVAATNFKQRTRKMLEYYHADRLNYAVAGTPNRLEYDQGFFVKGGDGAADFKPIAHLYKTQVFAMANYLGVPEKICKRAPTTDTYSLPQGQDEFYFALPYQKMDICMAGKNAGLPVEKVAEAAGLTATQVEAVFNDIDTKRRTTRYLHLSPVLVEKVPEVVGDAG